MGRKKHRVLMRIGLGLIGGLLGLAGGLVLASTLFDSSENSRLETALRESQTSVSKLQSEVQGLQSDLEEMESPSQALADELAGIAERDEALKVQLSQALQRESSALQVLAQVESELELATSDQTALREQVQLVRSQASRDKSSLEAMREMLDLIEGHRLLLVELRRDLPVSREESIAYWSNLKTAAVKADPSLASPANKVIIRIDNYYDWNERSPDPSVSLDAYLTWQMDFSTSGAIAYEEATYNFNKEALLSVINQMDSIVIKLAP